MERPERGLAIVTGASTGIGAELARQLARRGHPVLAVARREAPLHALALASKQAGHAAVHPLVCDVTSPDAAAVIRRRAAELGGAHWLVNNAGTARYGAFEAAGADDHRRQIQLNIEALVAVCAAIVPDLRARGRGVILNVSSLAAFQPTPYMAVYGASKAFVLSFSEALSEELRGSGVTVTALCPGLVVPTEIHVVGAPGVEIQDVHAMPVEECVRLALDGAEAGRVVVVPGLRSRFTAVGAQLLPRSWIRRISAHVALPSIGLANLLPKGIRPGTGGPDS